MKRIIYIVVLILAVSVSAFSQVDRSIQPKPGPAPSINLTKPQTFILPNGLTVMVVENHKLPKVSFSLSLDNYPSLEGEIKGVDDLTSSMMGNGTSKISKDEYNKQIDYYGASISFSVHQIGGSTLSRYFSEILPLVAQGVLDPVFTEEELESERAKLLDEIKSNEKNVPAIAGRVRGVLLYGKNHPNGEYLSEETINRVTLADVKKYYGEYFVPENAYLVIVGDVKFKDVKKLVTDNFSSWKKTSSPKSIFSDPVNLSKTEINFINVPNAVQTEVFVGNIIDLKMTSHDYFAALLANQILGGGSEGRLFINLREGHGWTYGAYSSIQGSKYISDFGASASVKSTFADSSVIEILNEIRRIRETLPAQKDLDLAKAKYIGSFVMNAEKPEVIASFALREKTQMLPSDFYENYIKNINAVTLQQIQDAAQKYMLYEGCRIIVVGKADEILEGLEALNIPVKYFDRYGNPTERPQKQVVSSDVTINSILENYINAIGGKETLSAVQSIMVTAKAPFQGGEMGVVTKITADGKSLQEVNFMGMTMMRAAFDGQKGYLVVQGQKKVMDELEVSEMKYQVPFPELLFLGSDDVTLKGIEDNSYVLSVGHKLYYYDIETGLKTSVASFVEIEPGNTIVQKTIYDDYRDINGIKIPHKMSLNLGVDVSLIVSEVKINEGVADSDFQ